jgi:hypothetical protein
MMSDVPREAGNITHQLEIDRPVVVCQELIDGFCWVISPMQQG